MDTLWRIEMLGGLRAVQGDRVVARFQTQQAGSLLAYLAYHGQSAAAHCVGTPRESLIELLWPECEPEVGRHRLSVALSALRQRLEPEGVPARAVIAADRATVHLNPEAITSDVAEFAVALQSAARAGSPAGRAEGLSQAVALYQGELLPGCYDDWVLQEREWLAERFFQALGQLIAHLEGAGDLERALEVAHRGVSIDPLREEAYTGLMRLYAAAGQPAAALRQYRDLERLLQAQLETTPAPATRALAREIERLSLLRPPPTVPRRGPVPRASGVSCEPLLTPAEGENRLVTVLFVDPTASAAHAPSASTYPLGAGRADETTHDPSSRRASTWQERSSAPRGPEAAAVLADRLLAVMVDVVLKYEGQIERLQGNGMLAVFGTLQAHEDDAERALRAALEIRQVARKLGLAVRAGISTGLVTPRALGLAGSVVDRASRLQQQAQPGEILVGEITYRQTCRAFTFTSHSPPIQSLPQPVAAYALKRALPRPEKVRGNAWLRAELIGREEELAKLQAALAELRQGYGQMVSIIGEAGIGKSRLVAELKAVGSGQWAVGSKAEAFRSVTPELSTSEATKTSGQSTPDNCPPLWLEGRCLELGMTASYFLFVDLFHDYLDQRPEEEGSDRVARLVASLQELVGRGDLSAERADEIGPLLGNLLSLRFENDWDVRLKNTDPEQIKYQTLLAVRDFFVALARQQPLLLVLEDLHWADSLSIDAISLLMEALSQAPLLLICVYRPEREGKSVRLGSIAARKCPERYTELTLRELTPSQSRRMLSSLLTIDPLPVALQELVLGRSCGNPFFLEEVSRALLDSGMLDPEAWRVREGVTPVKVPESVQSVVRSRLDRLGPEEKRVLQAASVIGRLFRRRVLEEALRPSGSGDVEGLAPGALEGVLWELEERALIYQERVAPEEEYSFQHVLTQETVYRSLVRRRRAALHQRVGAAIETVSADRLDEYIEQLAYHYEQGAPSPPRVGEQGAGPDEKAVEYLLKAGDKARRAYLNEAAADYFRRGMARLEAMPPEAVQSAPWQEWAIQLYHSLGDVLALTGQHEEARAAYQSALATVSSEDRARRSHLHRRIGDTWMPGLQYDTALEAYLTAEAALEEERGEHTLEWRQEWIDVQYDRMSVHYRRSEVAAMDALVEKVRPVLEQHGTAQQRLVLLGRLFQRNLVRDRLLVSDETLAYARELLAIRQAAGDPEANSTGRFPLGLTLQGRGEWDEAEPHLQAALAGAERTGDVTLQTFCLNQLTLVARKRGQVEETRRALERLLEAATTAQRPGYAALARGQRAWVAWREGNQSAAKEDGRAALEVLQHGSVLAVLQWAVRWPLIGVALAEDRLAEAVEHGRALLDPAVQPLPEPQAAAVEEAVQAYDAGRPAEARACLDRAAALAREINYL